MQILNGFTQTAQRGPVPYPWQPDGIVGIETLLTWAVREQKALDRRVRSGGLMEAEARAAGLPWQSVSACGCAAVERIASIGTQIDVSSADSGRVHDIAEAIVDVAISGGAHQALYHARTGTRPSLEEPPRWIVPELLSRAGTPLTAQCGTIRQVRYVKRVRTEVLTPVLWTPVRAVWGLAERRRMVSSYRVWEQELRWLAGVISTRFPHVAVYAEPPLNLGHLEVNDFA